MKILGTLFLFIFGIQYSFAQTIYVDASNNSNIEDGTEQHPFNTIKEGIEIAGFGYTVLIKNGTYTPDGSWSGNDQTLMLKAGLKLCGESRENTIINGILVDQEDSNLTISVENLTFNEFHFARGTHMGPFSNLNIIRNCVTNLISLPFGAGIPVNDTTPGPNYGFLIENNNLGVEGIIEFKQGAGISNISVLDNSCGYIYIKSGGGYTYLVDNNDVQYGIFDKSAVNNTTISNNRIYNGTISDLSGGNQFGIEDQVIENNTITADESSPAFIDEDYKAGITAKSRSATIRNNIITCAGNVSGIRSSAGAPLHIIDNTIILDEVQTPAPEPYEATSGIFNYSGWGYVTGNKITGGNMGYYSKAGTVEFANNDIEKAYTGFYSKGAEEVHNNTIKNCYGNGMILDGLSGPIYKNIIKDNAGSGIRITRVPIDLGGGVDTCPGNNVITGNGNYDLYIETTNEQYPILYAKYNVWDHENPTDILQYDIRDASDSTGLVTVDFEPWGYLGIDKPGVEDLRLFPNPSSGKFTVHSLQLKVERVEVVDLYGKVVAYYDWNSGSEVMEFDMDYLPGGIYFLHIISEKRFATQKIIIQ